MVAGQAHVTVEWKNTQGKTKHNKSGPHVYRIIAQEGRISTTKKITGNSEIGSQRTYVSSPYRYITSRLAAETDYRLPGTPHATKETKNIVERAETPSNAYNTLKTGKLKTHIESEIMTKKQKKPHRNFNLQHHGDHSRGESPDRRTRPSPASFVR